MTAEKPTKLSDDQKDMYRTVDTVNSQLEVLETFIARRFDEISMEINATSQQFDMVEDGLVTRFAEVLEILGAISYSSNGDSAAANTGVELEAIIEDTENAANNILDAADKIAEYVSDEKIWEDGSTHKEIREKITNNVQEILMACTFQDLTGQRIRNTLKNLHSIEERLSTTFEKLGIDVKPVQNIVEEHIKEASDQSEIDDMFSEEKAKSSEPASQDDIDGMFD